MKALNVCIFPSDSEIGLEIFKCLRFEKHVEIYGASSIAGHGECVYKNYYAKLPYISEDAFIESFNKYLILNEINYVFPAYDDVVLFLSKKRTEIKANIVTSAFETCFVTRSKRRTYEYFKKEAFCPKVYQEATEPHDWPIFAKPDIGQGSQGAQKVISPDDASKLGPEYVLMELLTGPEFTVDCFSSKRGLEYMQMRARSRVKSGISVRSELCKPDAQIEEIAQKIQSKLPFLGPWFFQLKLDRNGKYKLLEASPRVSGTMGVQRGLGVNIPLISLYECMGQKTEILKNDSHVVIDRSLQNRFKIDLVYKTLYIDYDDTVLNNEKPNPSVMHLLYSCRNNGKNIVLISRHAGNLFDSLALNQIDPKLFKKIIHLTKGEKKSNFIESENAIFIDDSFTERKDVSMVCGLPVFSTESIECLLDEKY